MTDLDEPSIIQPPKRRRRGWLTLVILAAAVIVLGAALVWVAAARPNLHVGRFGLSSPPPSALRVASQRCNNVGELADGDKTLFLNMQGNDSGSGMLSVEQVVCVLDALDVPTYVLTEMDETTALAGRQEETWGHFKASWTYHPDNGLDVLVRDVG
jgi:hypothetical protein